MPISPVRWGGTHRWSTAALETISQPERSAEERPWEAKCAGRVEISSTRAMVTARKMAGVLVCVTCARARALRMLLVVRA